MKLFQITRISVFILLFALLAPIISNAQTAGKGVIYQMTETKHNIQSRANKCLKYTSTSTVFKDLLIEYDEISRNINAAINQFIYELNRKKCLFAKFEKINKSYKYYSGAINSKSPIIIKIFHNEISDYLINSKAFCDTFDLKYKAWKTKVDGKEVQLLEVDPVAIAELGWTIYTDIQQMISEKAAGLTEILNALKIESSGELKTDYKSDVYRIFK
jgi:hypothetical protein